MKTVYDIDDIDDLILRHHSKSRIVPRNSLCKQPVYDEHGNYIGLAVWQDEVKEEEK